MNREGGGEGRAGGVEQRGERDSMENRGAAI